MYKSDLNLSCIFFSDITNCHFNLHINLAMSLVSLYLSDPAVDVQRLEGLGNLESLVCKLSKQKYESVIHLKIIRSITEEC